MHRRNILGIAATIALGFALVPGGAIAQQKTIKEQLVGAWTLLLDDGVKADGTHVPLHGPNPIGTHAQRPQAVCLKRMVTAITDEVLTYNTSPLRGFDHVELVLKKVK
jgi:hypothetical protein